MAEEGTPVDFVAIVVAFIALFIAVAQLLAQVFSTLEGYRRCQPSVLSDFWSGKTKRRWRWVQVRIEILFTTPEIALVCEDDIKPPDMPIPISKSLDSENPPSSSSILFGFWAKRKSRDILVNERVCWIPFIESVWKHHQKFRHEGHPQNTSWPMLFARQRSWDFMPPDVVRPFASISLSDIAILARRIGMEWTVFKPVEGVIEAQGNGHLLSSAVVRGLGLMLNYRCIRSSKLIADRAFSVDADFMMIPESFVCSATTDMMWFGILPGNPDLGLGHLELKIGTNEDIQSTLVALDPTETAARNLRRIQDNDPQNLHGFCDIVPMVAPWLRQRGTTINQYPRPCYYTKGLTWYHVGYNVFYMKLKEHNNGTQATGPEESPSTHWVQKAYEKLRDKYGQEWDGITKSLHARERGFFDELHDYYDQTTEYFKSTCRGESDGTPRVSLSSGESTKDNKFSYMDLVVAHLREAPRSHSEAHERLNAGKLEWRNTMYENRPWRGDAMLLYWAYMPDYVKFMDQRGYKDEVKVKEAWIILIFRAFLWQRAHVGIANQPALPWRFYGSELPIYIG